MKIRVVFAFLITNFINVNATNILIVGGGAREHVLAWKIAQAESVDRIYIAPGNAGTAREKKCTNIAINIDNIEGLCEFAEQNFVDLTIIGPELPLTLGIVDAFNAAGLACLGPTKQAAQIESSKLFTKQFCQKHNIPSASYRAFNSFNQAKEYVLAIKQFPIVIKADGLANGKGVVIAYNQIEACDALDIIMVKKKFGTAGSTVIVEEFLQGNEISFIVLTDGKTVIPLELAQDYKRRDNANYGPNTGGMGAYSPVLWVSEQMKKQILQQIIEPTVHALGQEGIEYTGFLYAGIMITKEGPKLLEYNCRLGDPEAQVILTRLESDLAELCFATIKRQLHTYNIVWKDKYSVCVVIANKSYPDYNQHESVINGLENENSNNCKIFHAATNQKNNQIIAAGGRVLSLVSTANSFEQARSNVYDQIKKIVWPEIYYRSDIALF